MDSGDGELHLSAYWEALLILSALRKRNRSECLFGTFVSLIIGVYFGKDWFPY
jgi:ribosomal protein S19